MRLYEIGRELFLKFLWISVPQWVFLQPCVKI